MGRMTANAAFDVPEFRAAVKAYMKRWQTSYSLFGLQAGVNHTTLKRFLDNEDDPTLYVAARLALACDLDLNKYIRELSYEDQRTNRTEAASRILDWRDGGYVAPGDRYARERADRQASDRQAV